MFRRLLPVLVVLLVVPGAAAASDAPETSPEAEELIARERIRAEIDEILTELRTPVAERKRFGERAFYEASEALEALGPASVPYLVPEVLDPTPYTFNIAAYVLGRLGTPEAAEALSKAIEQADDDPGTQFARARKEWAAYGLAILGDSTVLDRLTTGAHEIDWREFMGGMRLVETLAVLTLPDSVPRLVEQLKRYSENEDDVKHLGLAISALGRAGDPSAAPAIVRFLDHENVGVRGRAATALGQLGNPATADALLDLLDDPESAVRHRTAVAIEIMKPAAKRERLVKRLEVETGPLSRSAIYRTLAVFGGEDLIPLYRKHAAHPSVDEKMAIVNALGILGNRKGLNLLRAMIRHPDARIAIQAIDALERIGGDGAVDTLLSLVHDARWPVAQTAIERLAALREPRAAPRIAGRLLEIELSAPITDLDLRSHVDKMTRALVDLQYVRPVSDLRQAAKGQNDPEILRMLESTIEILEGLAKRGNDVAAWIEASRDPSLETRRLAYVRLADLGGEEAVRHLLSKVETVDVEEAVEVLRQLARLKSPLADPLIDRLLVSPEFDDPERLPLRAMAAWVARQRGGAAMISALERSARRRDGVDFPVLVYLALTAGEDAVATLRELRRPRFRHYAWSRGEEQVRLDWIVRELSAGRSLRDVDVPPERIPYH